MGNVPELAYWIPCADSDTNGVLTEHSEQ